jgi:dienelactone hydrolase
VNGTLLLPGSNPVRAIVVVVRHALGQSVFTDEEWRSFTQANSLGLLRLAGLAASDAGELTDADRVQKNSRLGGGRALLSLITALAAQTDRSGLKDAPLVIWGHSAAGTFARSFAAEFPERTAAIVSYHANARDVPIDVRAMARVAALVFAGELDDQAGTEDSETFWRQGRALGAPWAFVLEPGAAHGSPVALKRSHTLTLPWLRAIVAQRIAGGRLRELDVRTGWLADQDSLAVFAPPQQPPSARVTSWLPDEESARAWRTVAGKQ